MSRLFAVLAVVLACALAGCKHWSEAHRVNAETQARLAEAEIRVLETLTPEQRFQWALERARARDSQPEEGVSPAVSASRTPSPRQP